MEKFHPATNLTIYSQTNNISWTFQQILIIINIKIQIEDSFPACTISPENITGKAEMRLFDEQGKANFASYPNESIYLPAGIG